MNKKLFIAFNIYTMKRGVNMNIIELIKSGNETSTIISDLAENANLKNDCLNSNDWESVSFYIRDAIEDWYEEKLNYTENDSYSDVDEYLEDNFGFTSHDVMVNIDDDILNAMNIYDVVSAKVSE